MIHMYNIHANLSISKETPLNPKPYMYMYVNLSISKETLFFLRADALDPFSFPSFSSFPNLFPATLYPYTPNIYMYVYIF